MSEMEADLHRRLHQPGPLVPITKAQAAWLLERIGRAEAAVERLLVWTGRAHPHDDVDGQWDACGACQAYRYLAAYADTPDPEPMRGRGAP